MTCNIIVFKVITLGYQHYSDPPLFDCTDNGISNGMPRYYDLGIPRYTYTTIIPHK